MLAKKTAKNEITLPASVAGPFAEADSFDVSTGGECIILRPFKKRRAYEVRAQLDKLELDEEDVAAAVDWARTTP